MERMFPQITKTWNPVKGCLHQCYYPRGCWAYQLATGKLKSSDRYKDGFTPRLIEEELSRNFGKNQFIFVADMGDLFGNWVPAEWVVKIVEAIKRADPSNRFLFLTKNPKRYRMFTHVFPPNVVLGATIETNRNLRSLGITSAPDPIERYDWMRVLAWKSKAVAIEPIIDFDLEIFVKMVRDIDPEVVWVGYDNWHCRLPEPSLKKTLALIEELEKFTCVVKKTLREAANNEV
jgi:protein gp37